MEILVISDSHHKLFNVDRIMKNLKNSIDLVIHCGDNVTDANHIAAEYGIKTEYVKGNCDFGGYGEKEKIIEIENKKIFITHGHNYGVKYGTSNLYYKALEEKVDAVLYGHTHCASLEQSNGLIMLNPGSISEPRDGYYPSYALLSISNGNIYPCICRLQE